MTMNLRHIDDRSRDSDHPSDNSNLNTSQNDTKQKKMLKCNRSCNTEPCFQTTENEVSNLDGILLSTPQIQQNLCDLGRITVDAVHPLFVSYKDAATSTDNQKYYCRQCQIYLDLIQEAIIDHFENNLHHSSDSCIYCNGSVYEYFYNNKRIIYHKCNTSEIIEHGNTSSLRKSNDRPNADTDT